MTLADHLRTLDGRCPACLLHVDAQGHRSIDSDGQPTGCDDSGRLGLILKGQREADARKAEAFTRLDAADAGDENALLRREIVALGRRKVEFTPDDLAPELRQRTNPNRRGRVFSALISEGVLTEVGRIKSANPKAHGKTVGVYRLGRAA